MKVLHFDEQKDLPIDPSSIEPVVQEILAHEGVTCDEVIVHFVSKEKISQLHDEFFNDPSPTDCISFPLDDEKEEYRILGELFVCPKVAQEYVINKKSSDAYRETTLYLLHSLLHLVGYDDLDPLSKKKMRAAEKKHLANLRRKNLMLNK